MAGKLTLCIDVHSKIASGLSEVSEKRIRIGGSVVASTGVFENYNDKSLLEVHELVVIRTVIEGDRIS